MAENRRANSRTERDARKGNTSDADAIQVVKTFIHAINRHAPSEINGLMTEDHTFIDSGGGIQSGREHMTAGWESYFRLFQDYRIHAEDILADGTTVAVFGSASGTYNGRRGLVPENRIGMPAAWKAVVEGGKVKHWQVYADWTEGHRIIDADKGSGQRMIAGERKHR